MGRECGLGRIRKSSTFGAEGGAQLAVPLCVLAALETVAGHVEPARTRWIDVDRRQETPGCGGAFSDEFVIRLKMTTDRFVIRFAAQNSDSKTVLTRASISISSGNLSSGLFAAFGGASPYRKRIRVAVSQVLLCGVPFI